MRRDFDTHPKPCDFQSSDKFPRTVSRTKSFQRLRVLNPSGKPSPVWCGEVGAVPVGGVCKEAKTLGGTTPPPQAEDVIL